MSEIISNSEISLSSRSVSPVSLDSIDNNDTWFIDRTPNYDYARDIIYYNNYNNYNNYIGVLYNEINYGIIPIQNANHQGQQQVKFHIGIALQSLEISEEMRNCCICMEQREKDEICEFNCHHNFCGFCVKDILSKNNNLRKPKCPLCREDIKNIKAQKKEIQNKLDEYCVLLI